MFKSFSQSTGGKHIQALEAAQYDNNNTLNENSRLLLSSDGQVSKEWNVIMGLGGDDVIHGGTGKDTIYGGDGNDTLFVDGETSHLGHVLNGGAGDDTYYIATGANDFVFGNDFGKDTIVIQDGAGFRQYLNFKSVSSIDDIELIMDPLDPVDLTIRIKGTQDQVTVRDYYKDLELFLMIKINDDWIPLINRADNYWTRGTEEDDVLVGNDALSSRLTNCNDGRGGNDMAESVGNKPLSNRINKRLQSWQHTIQHDNMNKTAPGPYGFGAVWTHWAIHETVFAENSN